MKLCTFEVATHLGRHCRVGASKSGLVVDLNFAFAWYMAQSGEPDPQPLADALVPSAMPTFLNAGLRAMHSAEELFLGAGPHPADWWRKDPPPRGPNDETLVYPLEAVRLLSPLAPSNGVFTSGPVMPQFAAVGGVYIKPGEVRRDIAGFTLRLASKSDLAEGPFLATPDEVKDSGNVTVVLRINGGERLRATTAALRSRLETRPLLRPREVLACDLADRPLSLAPGDEFELEAEPIGALRGRVE